MDPKNKKDQEWKEKLTDEQYRVLRGKETEAPFSGVHHDSKEQGMYHCVACGTELFSSEAKFDSGTGWPSFTQPINPLPGFVYVLKMNNGQWYVGSTTNLVRRVKEHKTGRVFSTKRYLPVSLIHYETYNTEKEARIREKHLKHHGSAFAKLKEEIGEGKEISLAGFTDPVAQKNVELRPDDSQGMHRTEVICKNCGGHLGHVFDDGPEEAGGKRYCINSCVLDLKKK